MPRLDSYVFLECHLVEDNVSLIFFFIRKVEFDSQKRVSAHCIFKMEMIQPALAPFNFNLEGRQMIRMDHHRVHQEKIPMHVHLQFLTCVTPERKLFQSPWLSQFDWLRSDKKNGSMRCAMIWESGQLFWFWLVVLGFNATLIAKVIWQSVTYLSWYSDTSINTTFFPKPPTTFSHASYRGERRKHARKKVCLNHVSNSQPPGHESDTLTTHH